MSRLPFTMRARRRISQHGVPHRPTVNWCSGTLPAPWAAGDIVEVMPGSAALERMHGDDPGLYIVDTAFSIDEGDAWYFRIDRPDDDCHGSDRLHVARSDPFSTWGEDVDYMAGVNLVHTLDPEGLAERADMIAAGWALRQTSEPCGACHGTGKDYRYREATGVWRIQQRRTKGWHKPPGAVSVARPGRFGNPFVGENAARSFRTALAARRGGVHVPELDGYPSDDEIRDALRGRLLMCWCGLDADCHADFLAEWANA